jgi:16S rRNA U516 pseudouridylate synthase RsuA-like enzyme
VCDWIVTVKINGTMVISVTCKTKQKKWKTHEKATTTIIITPAKIIIIITKNKGMKISDTDNRGHKMCIIFCLYQNIFDKQQR